jgi:hypothetical protein
VIALCTVPATASAYVGIVYLSVPNIGSFLDLSSRQLAASDWTQEYVAITSDVIDSSNGFIQAGIYSGNVNGGDCDIDATPSAQFFWSDDRPNGGGYHCYTTSSPVAFGQNYGTTLYYRGGGTWSVGVGPLYGTSTSSITGSTQLETGTGESDQSSLSCSASDNMVYYPPGGGTHEGWSKTGNGGGWQQSKPPYAAWVDPWPTSVPGNTWVRHYTSYCY